MRLGIIGLGGMGSWLALRAVKSGITVYGYDKDPGKGAGIDGVRRGDSINWVLENSDTVIIATPPAALPGILDEIASSGWRGSLADISTFKKRVIPLLERLPRGVRAASLHPLFGPRAGLDRRYKVLIVPVPGREGDVEPFRILLDRLGLSWSVMDYRRHDRIMGLVIGLPYAIGHALSRILGEDLESVLEASGTTFKSLYLLLSTVSDPEELVESILGDPDTRYWIERLREELGRAAGRRDLGLYQVLYCLVEECYSRHLS